MKKLILLLILPVFLVAETTEIKSISVSSAQNYVSIDLNFNSTPSNLHDFVLKRPARIVIDAEGVKYALSSNIFPVNQGDVIRIRGSQFKTEPLVARVVIDLRKNVKYEVVKGEKAVTIKVFTTPTSAGYHKTVKGTEVAKTASTHKVKNVVRTHGEKIHSKTSPTISVGNTVFYNSHGRRDPFKPITQTAVTQDTLLDIAKAKLIGVIQDSTGYVALVEDKDGNGFILRRGDRIKRGRVVRVTKDMAVFAISDFGFTRTVILKLEKEEVSK